MKKVLFIFLLVLTSVSFGQDFKLIDSVINKILEKKRIKDKIELYQEFSQDYLEDNYNYHDFKFFDKKIMKTWNRNKNPLYKLNSFLYNAKFLVEHQKYDTAKSILEKLLTKTQNKYNDIYFSSLTHLVDLNISLGEIDAAKKYVRLILNNSSKTKKNESDANFLLGSIYDKQGFYNLAMSQYLLADSSLKNNSRKKSVLNSDISRLYLALKKDEKAKKYADISLKIAQELKDTFQINYLSFFYAELEQNKKEFQKAKKILQEAKMYFEKIKYDYFIYQFDLAIGNNEIYMGNYSNAISQLTKTYNENPAYFSPFEKYEYYSNLALCYVNLNELKVAKTYIDSASKINSEINYIVAEIRLLNILEQYHIQSGDYKKAYESIKLKDSVNLEFHKISSQDEINELIFNSKINKKGQEITSLKSKNKLAEQEKKAQRNKLIGGIILTSLAGIFLFFLYRNKKKTNKKLEELNATKTRFFENISHEFRTPLTLIKLPVSRALKTKENLTENHLNTIHNNASRLQNLIEDLLSLSEMDAGKMKVKISEQNPLKQTKILSSQFDSYAENAGIKYVKNIESKNITAEYDSSVVEKVLSNLISNAIKYSKKGEEVVVDVSLENQNLILKISDTGDGISVENQQKIFERFYQVNEKDESKQGSGIGLALVKRLLELNNGSISVSSKKGEGSTFTAVLPLEKIQENKSVLETKTEPKSSVIKEKEDLMSEINISDKPQLLIVEDNLELLQYIKELFENDFVIHQAENGKEGLEKAIEFVPDIVISDWMMPIMNGIELCEKVKTNTITSHIPLLLLTAKAEVKDKIKGYETGADAYFSKPFDFEELQAQINNLISQRKKLVEKYSNSQEEIPTKITSNSQDIKFWEEFKNHLKNHLSNPDLSAESLAKELLMSRMQLHRKLKALTGQTVGILIKNQRMKLASELLKDSSVRVTDVWHQVGYSEKSSFSRAFKNEFGVTPGEFKGK